MSTFSLILRKSENLILNSFTAFKPKSTSVPSLLKNARHQSVLSRENQDDETVSMDENLLHAQSDESEDSDLQEMRNASGLPPKFFSQYHGEAPERPYKDHQHIKERYARFGAASGEDARILWPSRQEILAKEQEEMEEGMSLVERLASLHAQQEVEHKAIMERRKMIEKNMAQMPKWIAEYRKKQELLAKEAHERAERKETLLEEARDYFGYRIKANDPKFQQMVEEKEEREKKEAKKKKKEERLKKQADRLAAEITKVSQMTKAKTQSESKS